MWLEALLHLGNGLLELPDLLKDLRCQWKKEQRLNWALAGKISLILLLILLMIAIVAILAMSYFQAA